MNSDIIESPISRAKKFLGIDGEIIAIDLYYLIGEYRKNYSHPDKFIDYEKKKLAEENFNTAKDLMEELSQVIQGEELESKPSKLALYKDQYRQFYLQKEIEDKYEIITNQNEKIKTLEDENKLLSKMLEEKDNNSLDNELKTIESMYKPSKHSVASLGLAFILTTSMAIMSKVEDISILIKKYSPIDESFINLVLFFVFISLLTLTAKQLFENLVIKQMAYEVCTPKFSTNFKNYIDDIGQNQNKGKRDFFLEREVYTFIEGRKTWWKRILASIGFKIYQDESIDRLKNYFISNLLNKKLIKISDADSLDRSFLIIIKSRWGNNLI